MPETREKLQLRSNSLSLTLTLSNTRLPSATVATVVTPLSYLPRIELAGPLTVGRAHVSAQPADRGRAEQIVQQQDGQLVERLPREQQVRLAAGWRGEGTVACVGGCPHHQQCTLGVLLHSKQIANTFLRVENRYLAMVNSLACSSSSSRGTSLPLPLSAGRDSAMFTSKPI